MDMVSVCTNEKKEMHFMLVASKSSNGDGYK